MHISSINDINYFLPTTLHFRAGCHAQSPAFNQNEYAKMRERMTEEATGASSDASCKDQTNLLSGVKWGDGPTRLPRSCFSLP